MTTARVLPMMGRTVYTDSWITLNGVRLHYQAWGRAEAPPLLLLHGLTQQSHTFDALAMRLRDHYRALALDIRGRGESEWAPPETYTVPHYVADVLALLDALGLPAIHLFGTSLGGLIGLSLSRVAPERLLSLGLNDIGPEIDPRGLARIADYAAAIPERLPSFEAALAWSLEHYPWLATMPRDRVVEAVRWGVQERPDGASQFKLDPAIGRTPRPAPQAAHAASQAWWGAFTALRCPLLLIRGAESDVLSSATAEEMQRRQPGLLRVDVPGVGHAPTLEEPLAVAALERFYLGRA